MTRAERMKAATVDELADKALGLSRVLAYKGDDWWEEANAAVQELVDRAEQSPEQRGINAEQAANGEDAQATIGTVV